MKAKNQGEIPSSSSKGVVGAEKVNGRRDTYRSRNRNAMVRPKQQKPAVSGAGVNIQANNSRRETTMAEARRVSTVSDSQIEGPSSWVMDRESSGMLDLKQRTSDLVGKGEATIKTNEGDRILSKITPDMAMPPTTMIEASEQIGTESELIYSDSIDEMDTVLPPTAREFSVTDMENGFVKSGITVYPDPVSVNRGGRIMGIPSSVKASEWEVFWTATDSKEVRRISKIVGTSTAGVDAVVVPAENDADTIQVGLNRPEANRMVEMDRDGGGAGS